MEHDETIACEAGNRPRFRPQLIAIPRQRLNFDSATGDWPEPASASLIPKVGAVVNGARKDALSRGLN